jgi:hypothetical protein
MKDGFAHVDLDAILSDIIFVNDSNPLRVFSTPVNMLEFNGVTITNSTAKGFDLVELNGGKHSGKIDFTLSAKPRTNYGEGRFPQAPGPAFVKPEKEPAAAKAKNNPADGRPIFHWGSDWDVYHYNPEDMVNTGDVIPAGPNHGKVKLANGKYAPGIGAARPK